VNTAGQIISDEPKIMAALGIIDYSPQYANNPFNLYNQFNGRIGIEVRGSSSQVYLKKSYGFETR
jgi:hypothetical protein